VSVSRKGRREKRPFATLRVTEAGSGAQGDGANCHSEWSEESLFLQHCFYFFAFLAFLARNLLFISRKGRKGRKGRREKRPFASLRVTGVGKRRSGWQGVGKRRSGWQGWGSGAQGDRANCHSERSEESLFLQHCFFIL